jgi:hypothetical protein
MYETWSLTLRKNVGRGCVLENKVLKGKEGAGGRPELHYQEFDDFDVS